MKAFKLNTNVETNIVLVDIISYNKTWDKDTVTARVSSLLKEKGIEVSQWGTCLMRLVIHRDISNDDISKVITIMNEVSDSLYRDSNSSYTIGFKSVTINNHYYSLA
jgi:threonine aldolase